VSALVSNHLHGLIELSPGDADFATRWRLIKGVSVGGSPAANPRSSIRPEGGPPTASFLWERRPRRESPDHTFGPRAGLPRVQFWRFAPGGGPPANSESPLNTGQCAALVAPCAGDIAP